MSEQYADLWELTKAQSAFISHAWHGKVDMGDKRPAILRTPYGEYTYQNIEGGFRVSAQMVEDGRINALQVHRLQSATDLAQKLERIIIGNPAPVIYSQFLVPSARVFAHASYEPDLMSDFRFYYGVRLSPLQDDTDALGYYERWPVLRLQHKAMVIADMETVRFYNASVKVHTQYEPGDDWYVVKVHFRGWVGAGHLATFGQVT